MVIAASLTVALIVIVGSSSAAGKPPPGHGPGKKNHGTATMSVFASGFNNARGLTFGPDGNLYVAEGGLAAPPRRSGSARRRPAPPHRISEARTIE